MPELRDYQTRAVAAILEEWKDCRSTLAVLPTGVGKTQIACEVISQMQPQKAMFLAHREELIWQPRERLKQWDIDADVEMGEYKAGANYWNQRSVVISTIQTQIAGRNGDRRMTKFRPQDYGLLVIDEAHHATSKSYRQIIDHYSENPDLKILGITATPDRADEEALGQVFQTVAFDYGILDAIKDGWLVPIEQQMVSIAGLDYSHIRTTAGDLNGADLAAVMEQEQNIQGVASSTLEIIGKRKTLVFTATVDQAERLSEIFNRHPDIHSEWVSGKTPKDTRRETLKRFSSGETQIVVNCAVFTEGFDEPSIQCIVMARPTKSRSLYSQMVGRSTRPLPGVVDAYTLPELRRQAIAESKKVSCLIIDFVGNAGRHKLISTVDILGGNITDDVLELAIRKAQKAKGARRTEEVIAEAQREMDERRKAEALRRLKFIAKANYTMTAVDAFNLFDIAQMRERGWDIGRRISEKMAAMLRKMGVDPAKTNYSEARILVGEQIRRWKEKLCSPKQAALLKRYGYDPKNIKFDDAKKLIDRIASNGWRRVS